MITDKDREDAEKIAGLYVSYDRDELAACFIARIRTESAEQARKDAAERAAEWFKTVFCVPENAKTKGLRSAILGDTAPVSTDSEKLAIAVKALEEIESKHIPSNVFESQYSRLQEACTKAREALKEIQG